MKTTLLSVIAYRTDDLEDRVIEEHKPYYRDRLLVATLAVVPSSELIECIPGAYRTAEICLDRLTKQQMGEVQTEITLIENTGWNVRVSVGQYSTTYFDGRTPSVTGLLTVIGDRLT